MTDPAFDAEGLFDDDYLYFFGEVLDERGDTETDLIWNLLGLEPGMEVLDLACGHGRISNRLAALGCRVTGCSPSPSCAAGCTMRASARSAVTARTAPR